MSFLIAIFVVLLLTLSISLIFRKKFEYMLPIVVAAISLTLYIASFFGQRTAGIYIIVIASLFSVIYSISLILRGSRKMYEVFKSSGLIFFIIVLVIICLLVRGFVFSTWDEFSHWGLIIKNMYLTNDFTNLGDSTTLFKWYPPGVSLFLNFTTSFSKSFSEASALGGLLVLSFAQLLTIFVNIKYNDWKKILLVTTLIILAPLVFFGNFYSTIYVDAILALVFVNILFFDYSYPRKDLFYAIYMGLQFYLLVNTKQIGIVLAALAFVAIFVNFVASKNLKPISSFISRTKNDLVYVFIPLITGFITYASWSIYIHVNNIVENFSSPSIQEMINLLGPNLPAYKQLTIVNFTQNFFAIKQYGSVFLSPFLWSVIFAFTMYGVYRLAIHKSSKKFLFQLMTILGLCVYSGIILMMYLTSFDEYESTNLASVDRYLGTYFLSLLLLTVFIVIHYLIKSYRGRLSSNVMITLLIAVIAFTIPGSYLVENTVLRRSINHTAQNIRGPYEGAKQYAGILKTSTDKIYIISQGTNGLDYYILRYNFSPVHTQNGSELSIHPIWSLGRPYSADDQWTIDINAQGWKDILKDYTHVYLNNIDAQFINAYGQLFENVNDIKNTSMYRIEKTDGGILLKLLEVNNSHNE